MNNYPGTPALSQSSVAAPVLGFIMFTIGTSNRTQVEFFEELARRNIKTIVDVRSKPWSRLPHFRKPALAESTPLHGMRYEWMGEVLGGLNDIRTDDPAFLAAIDRLLTLEAKAPVAIFCSEGDAAMCHRSGKVGAGLLVYRGVDPVNILRDGGEEAVSHTLLRTKAGYIPPCIRDQALRLALCQGAGPLE